MKVAIHTLQSGRWHKCWLEYCQAHDIDYEEVNCYSWDIIDRLRNFDALLWNFHHAVPEDMLMGRNVLYAAKELGLRVFPDFNTCWHFDDKVAETYLLQAIDAPIVPSWMFYNRNEAIKWLSTQAEFPLVAKLRRGAGSGNVKLLKSLSEAKSYTRKMFGRGFSPSPRYFQDAMNHYKRGGNWAGRLARIRKVPGYFRKVFHSRKFMPRENGYAYFQKFISNDGFDIRISVIKDKAWGFVRLVREGDFRASGSGLIDYDIKRVPLHLVEQAFEISRRLKSQSICFDYIENNQNTDEHAIVEISYGFVPAAIYNAPGYWDAEMNWHEGHIDPAHEVLINLLELQ